MTDGQLKEFIDALTEAENGYVTGPLHIIVEDCNVKDIHLEMCHISACEEGDWLSIAIVAALYRRAPDERRKLLGWPEEYAVDEEGEHDL